MQSEPDTTEITAAEAVALVASEEVWLLDVREDYEWANGHAPSAHHLPMHELSPRQDELPDDATIAVICHLGGRSRSVTDALNGANYRAINIAGGMNAWAAAGGPVTDPAPRGAVDDSETESAENGHGLGTAPESR